MESELLISLIEKRKAHLREIRTVSKDIITAQKAIPPESINDMVKYNEPLCELITCRSEKIKRLLQSDVTLDNQESKPDQSMEVIQPDPKRKKKLRDLQENGEDDDGVRSELEDDDAESAVDQFKNRTGTFEKNVKANLKMTADFEYDDLFSEIAIGRGYDWKESNVDRSNAPIPAVLG